MKERPMIFSAPMVRALLDGSKTQTRRLVSLRGPYSFVEYSDGWYNTRGPLPHVSAHESASVFLRRCPYGVPGDRLWVRETWTADVGDRLSDMRGAWWHEIPHSLRTSKAAKWLYYAADKAVAHGPCEDDGTSSGIVWPDNQSTWDPTTEDLDGIKWQSPLFMPRWASRITLEILDVRVQRLQEISEKDAIAEGVDPAASPEDCSPDDADLSAECGYFPLRSYVDGYERLWDTINGKRAPWASNPWVWSLTFASVTP